MRRLPELVLLVPFLVDHLNYFEPTPRVVWLRATGIRPWLPRPIPRQICFEVGEPKPPLAVEGYPKAQGKPIMRAAEVPDVDVEPDNTYQIGLK